MKRIKHDLFFTFVCVTITLSACIHGATTNEISGENTLNDDCLAHANFDLVKNYILKNGKLTKLYKTGIMADTTTFSRQVCLKNKTLALVDYSNYYHIIIISQRPQDSVATYYISDDKNPCLISAYYSMLDTEKTVASRKNDWCKIVNAIKKNYPI
ncbi:MAG: hypothetical protein WCQ95_05475 [Bacteroidota bacterium]